MLRRHFLRFITWYILLLSMLVAGATWHHFNTRISQINHQIKTHAVEK